MALNPKLSIVVAAAVAMSAGYWLSSLQDETSTAEERALADARQAFSPIQGIVLTPPRKIAVPALSKDDGSVFTLDDLSGHWSLLFFGYMHCPDICPVTMGVVAQAKDIAVASGQIFPEVYFVSVDPERDKVEILGEYVRYFDRDFTGVTGEESLIKALTLQMSVVYMKMPATGRQATSDAGSYDVDHSSALLLLNPEGRLAAFLNPPHDVKTILKDMKKVISLQ